MPPSIDAKAFSWRRRAELGSFLDLLYFRGGGPTRGEGISGEPDIVRAARGSVGKPRHRMVPC